MRQGLDALRIAEEDWHQGAEVELAALSLIGGGEPRQGQFTGIKALMLAVLDDAIVVYLGRPGRPRQEAEAWIESERRRSPFAFVVICEMLGLDAAAVRTVLRQWRTRRLPPREALGRTRGNAQAQSETRAAGAERDAARRHGGPVTTRTRSE